MSDDERTVLQAQIDFMASEIKGLNLRLSNYHGNLVLLQKQIEDLQKKSAIDVTQEFESAE